MGRFDLLHVSTGDLFRESLEKRSALGLLARRYMNQGELVPDEVVGSLIEEWLWKVMSGKRILFDGFPRNIYQAKMLDDLFRATDRHLEAVIYLKVPDEVIIRRLPGRVICRVCQTPYHLEFKPPAIVGCCDLCRGKLYQRKDDNPETVRVRLKTSHRDIDPLVDFYQERGLLTIIDGEGAIDQVYESLIEAIEAIQNHRIQPVSQEQVDQIRALKEVVQALAPEQVVHHSLDLILLGGPGSGKGTQAQILQEQLNLEYIATGNLFRENIIAQTDLGKLAKNYIDRGELVPDDVTEAMVRERLSRTDGSHGFVLDGFPRTIPQAEALTEMMTIMQRRLNGVLHVKVSDEHIMVRLSGRRTCRNCHTTYHLIFKPPQQENVCDLCQGELYQRNDDHPETIQTRLKTYHGQTEPLINYYRAAGLLIEIDGEGEIHLITDRIMSAVQNLIAEVTAEAMLNLRHYD
jgi:adenylate kinase